MNKKSVLVIISVIILAFFIGMSEKAKTQDDVKTNRGLRPLNLDVVYPQIDEILIQHAADSAIANVMRNYQSILDSGVRHGGPINAIRITQGVFPAILKAHSQNGWTIDFASDKNRNNNLRAETDEKIVLEYFADSTTILPDKGEWLGSGDNLKYRFYKPLWVEKSCLSCHGKPEDLPPQMTEELDKLYPEDKAIGLKANDLYGIFVVEIEWPKGKKFAFVLAENNK